MKTLLAITAAITALSTMTAEARPNCPGGQGYWEEVVRNVRVCDTQTETYTVTLKNCNYSGHLYLGFLWNKPDFPLPHTRYETDSRRGVTSCPASIYSSESEIYWYTNSSGFRTTDWATYSGHLFKSSEQTYTEDRTRTVETNCRTEQRVTRVFRCGFEP
ncbi:hypothetical protein [Pseudoalteromonas luteoviolacea]|uniref:Ig-like domain-containing protein n=1 Tax=Pseudoalteromonas luteoviolacea DSM 6061 TaxID=1365250 RepID=A0A166U8W9_9GAMM|nr:hypothetical protein [Pseudoalteromonas luteoviolacea]KZN29677.1 hypothetical protein N475_05110 [Pseudoalteromonas luteoviolacea DSM 6061]KZN53237.1 hypothetical protein N474_21240 [Pseudoalteromonas luteoviolacea CPMOR-2]MBE0389433.1 hypothetical protein [Pseudoalteromonas luteoviolacea DSM 6061]TQF67893.1 hypothetical protein FLM44_22200 [Pseudoalteromonas luteoviolacea]